MSIESTLTELIESGVGPIVIGKPPANSAPPGQVPNFFAKADHNIPTGSMGNSLQTVHQAVGETVAECVNRLKAQVERVEKFKVKGTNLVILPKRNGRIVTP